MITHLLHPGHSLARRLYSSASVSSLELQNLDTWIASEKTLSLRDTLTPTHLADLYVTLPTRDGTRGENFSKPIEGLKLEYGHHLAFFHPRNPEAVLRPDGTDADFCPPEPFTRRMWAGGSMKWLDPLAIGQKVDAVSTVSSVEKKGFEKGSPMVFVNQTINYTIEGRLEPSVVERRAHVYLPPGLSKREPREGTEIFGTLVRRYAYCLCTVKGIRSSSEFSFRYTPTATTLFRFSALTFNGHHIHLDKDYAQKEEGYPGKHHMVAL